MLIIEKGKNDSIDKMLKILKQKTIRTGIIKELKKRQEFEKPSVTKRKQKLKAIYIQKIKDNEHSQNM